MSEVKAPIEVNQDRGAPMYPPVQNTQPQYVQNGTDNPYIVNQIPGQPIMVLQQNKQIFTRQSQMMVCPNCSYSVQTVTTKELGLGSYLAAGACCLVCFPCFWVPLVIDDLKDVTHHCPQCRALVGEKKLIQ
ncbi:LITAF-like zinc ribbon domain-containing protein [Globomyces pollinis-pini]|nr:LITAF-like zinc ribbon domain-containing protein [Globomyces pollinis-pini]